MRLSTALVLVALFLSGCASAPQMTRAEYLQLVQRTYANKTPDEVFAAAEKLFLLADGDDFTFSHSENAMIARRTWTLFLVIGITGGVDTWTVTTTKVDGGTKVSVAINRQIQSATAAPTARGDIYGLATTGLPNNVEGTAIYDVFWSRMDYLLGSSKHWMTCTEANFRVYMKVTQGINEPLCLMATVKDKLPPEIESDPSLLPPQPTWNAYKRAPT